MKSTLLITALLAAVLATGCKKSAEKPASQINATTTEQLDKAQAAAKDATQQMQDYTFAQKTEFIAKMQTQLADLNRSLDELSAKIDTSSAAVKTEAKPKLDALREQAAQLKKQLGDVTNATSSTWSSIKADSQKAYTSMKDGLAQCRQWASDKMAM